MERGGCSEIPKNRSDHFFGKLVEANTETRVPKCAMMKNHLHAFNLLISRSYLPIYQTTIPEALVEMPAEAGEAVKGTRFE